MDHSKVEKVKDPVVKKIEEQVVEKIEVKKEEPKQTPSKSAQKKRIEISRDIFESIEPWAKHYNKPTALYIEELIVKSYMEHEIILQNNSTPKEPKIKSIWNYEKAKKLSIEMMFMVNPFFWIALWVVLIKKYYKKK